MVSTLGILLLPMSNDLLAFYTVLELQSFSLYLLTGMHSRSLNSTRAAMLYLIIGGIASAIILMGIYYIYELTGSTNISTIAQYYKYNPNYLYPNIILAGLLIKMGMAPAHQ
jgi:NADH:ubiquinone oxidoreductase subunit 2 (subunit N)